MGRALVVLALAWPRVQAQSPSVQTGLRGPAPDVHSLAVWANDGADKVTQDELRMATGAPGVLNNVWDGETIKLFAARNEVVAFNLVIEAATQRLSAVRVTFDTLSHDSGASIASRPGPTQSVFDWRQRPIELFFVRYLAVAGLSRLSYDTYDERHVPLRLRRPFTGQGSGTGLWTDRPDHDKQYPDIAVPLEVVGRFDVPAGLNQSVWVDVFVPPATPAGMFTGTLRIERSGGLPVNLPVELEVLDFALPDEASARTMAVLGYPDINLRYTGTSWPNCGSTADIISKRVRDRHFKLAHRHRISLIDSESSGCSAWTSDQPRPEWMPRLDGSLYSATSEYDGPGLGTPHDIYSIGTYGGWSWKGQGQAAMEQHTDAWETWFASNFPGTEHFLYLIDESPLYPQTEMWASWIGSNPGPGQNLASMATLPLPTAASQTPSLDVAASWLQVGVTSVWQAAADAVASDPEKRFYLYNGNRPAAGSFCLEDDGVALRVLAWAQFKKQIDRWFYWETTYYNNYQGGMGQTNVFRTAQTFGAFSSVDPVLGETGWNYSNGDGVLFYPGTDMVYPNESYGLQGPLASLRLKHWRRGIQDHQYLTLAAALDPVAVTQLVDAMVPKVLWEYGVNDINDPTWVKTDISWSVDPDVWGAARQQLANIILQ
jgi:hypothetical protein